MNMKALLINDSRFESMIMKDMLQKLSFTVEVADEFEALYAIERHEPDLVVVNYIMQQTRGDKLIQLMKAGMPHIKCVLSSNSDIKMSDFPEGHIDGIIHTPVSKFMLENVLNGTGIYNKEEVDTHCKNCNRDLSQFKDIEFCPFCGTHVT